MRTKTNKIGNLEWEIVTYWYPIYGPHKTGKRWQVRVDPCKGVTFFGEGDTKKAAILVLKRRIFAVLKLVPSAIDSLKEVTHHDYHMRKLWSQKHKAAPVEPRPANDPDTGFKIEYLPGGATLPQARPGDCTSARYGETDRQLFARWVWWDCPHCGRYVMIRSYRKTQEQCKCGARRTHRSNGAEEWTLPNTH